MIDIFNKRISSTEFDSGRFFQWSHPLLALIQVCHWPVVEAYEKVYEAYTAAKSTKSTKSIVLSQRSSSANGDNPIPQPRPKPGWSATGDRNKRHIVLSQSDFEPSLQLPAAARQAGRYSVAASVSGGRPGRARHTTTLGQVRLAAS